MKLYEQTETSMTYNVQTIYELDELFGKVEPGDLIRVDWRTRIDGISHSEFMSRGMWTSFSELWLIHKTYPVNYLERKNAISFKCKKIGFNTRITENIFDYAPGYMLSLSMKYSLIKATKNKK